MVTQTEYLDCVVAEKGGQQQEEDAADAGLHQVGDACLGVVVKRICSIKAQE